jgi:hypothetical protein
MGIGDVVQPPGNEVEGSGEEGERQRWRDQGVPLRAGAQHRRVNKAGVDEGAPVQYLTDQYKIRKGWCRFVVLLVDEGKP